MLCGRKKEYVWRLFRNRFVRFEKRTTELEENTRVGSGSLKLQLNKARPGSAAGIYSIRFGARVRCVRKMIL